MAVNKAKTARAVKPSAHTGMGSIPYEGGTAFRVWAPHASSVFVTGDFNNWSDSSNPLAKEEGGTWSGDITGAKPGDEYRYVIVSNDNKLFRKDPYGRDVHNSNGNTYIVDTSYTWGTGTFVALAWNDLVIYEMHIGTFNDQPGGSPGNLSKAIERLGHVKELGANAVQIMPITEFPGSYSWGYNPTDIFAIETDYGGANGLKDFIREAHGLGLAVIIDVVYNHLGPSDLDLWQFDGWNKDGKGGIYFYNDWRSKTPWGDTRPDYGRSEVRQFLRDNAVMWLEEFKADGLRWDMTLFIRTVYGNQHDSGQSIGDGWSLMQWINDEVNRSSPGKICIAEDLQDNEWVTKDTGAGGAGFDAQWAANFVHPIRSAVITGNDANRNMWSVCDAITGKYNVDAFERVVYTESHDEVANGRARVPQDIWPGNAGSWYSRKRSTLGAVLVFTSPGIPMIFQGQDILEDEWFRDTDPIDWSKKQTYGGIFRMYRDLVTLRRNAYKDTRGLQGQYVNVFHVNNYNKVIAFHRFEHGGPGDDVIVVLNMANRSYDNYTIGLPREGWWRVRFNSDWDGYSDDFGNHFSYDTRAGAGSRDGLGYHANIGLGPYSAIILTQSE
jgi:1,4-alpha-glucan branching enzyme